MIEIKTVVSFEATQESVQQIVACFRPQAEGGLRAAEFLLEFS